MSWLRLDDGYALHPKIIQLSDREFRVWLKTLLWCARYRTQGHIQRGMFSDVGLTAAFVKKLVELGLLDEEGAGWKVHDFEEFNPKDPTAAERQRRKRERDNDRDIQRDTDRDTGVTQPRVRAQAAARDPSPTPEPLGEGVGKDAPEGDPPDAAARGAAPALSVVPDPEPDLTDAEREENAKRARDLVERVTPPPPSEEPTAEEIAERERRSAASRARLAHDQADTDADIPLR